MKIANEIENKLIEMKANLETAEKEQEADSDFTSRIKAKIEALEWAINI